MSKKLLIVFIKNPKLGKVKTRLAATIGEQKALRIYQLLLDHTLRVSNAADADKVVYYSEYIPANDSWIKAGFQQQVQNGDDLGARMSNAFRQAFIKGYEQVVLIGSDCYDLDVSQISEAFAALHEKQVVIGPAHDGGYYLIGMNDFYPSLFQNKNWSSETVFSETISSIEQENISYHKLEQLSDIDDLQDLIRYDDLFILI